MADSTKDPIRQLLITLYGSDTGEAAFNRLAERLVRFKQEAPPRNRSARELFTERDVILITYAGTLRRAGDMPLQTLRAFFNTHLASVINTIHLLPFYPYSSDDGFSVIDYMSVKPEFGTWDDIRALRDDGTRLMFDAVINHISAHSAWFEAFKAGDPAYRDYFIVVDPAEDLSMVTRPRALPLLTPVETARGTEHLWTTFSADQIDLNYANPDTLLDVIEVLLEYIAHGAEIIRLDAIAYLWKEIGTTSIHLPQTHAVVCLLRAIVDEVAPGVMLITETNVPHDENVSYFGDGTNEAHAVYNFSLPPLTAHALLTGSVKHLSTWARTLSTSSDQTTFFNFTASHDGVGVRPAAGILSADDLELLMEQTRASGGRISSKANSDGSSSPYELNVTYFDLLNGSGDDPQEIQVRRFLVSQAIMLALAGIPGIYIHNLLGSRNDIEAVSRLGHARAINRAELSADTVEAELSDPGSLRHAVFSGYRDLLTVRIHEPAFHPNSGQRVLDVGDTVFALERYTADGSRAVLGLHNIAAKPMIVVIPSSQIKISSSEWRDLLTGDVFEVKNGELAVELDPYAVRWLSAAS